jgi:anti-sigma factor RsiW
MAPELIQQILACLRAYIWIDALVTGDLPIDRYRKLVVHVARCPRCRTAMVRRLHQV